MRRLTPTTHTSPRWPIAVFAAVLTAALVGLFSSALPARAEITAEQITRVFVSTSTEGWVDGLAFDDDDIIVFDTIEATWSLFFDGSDVGLEADDLTGFHIIDSTADLAPLLLTLQRGIDVPGVGPVEDSDILLFTPTSIGETTAGTFSMFLDGSTVGLTTTGEDIDALSVAPDGRTLISTLATPTVRGADGERFVGRDEDLLALNADGSFEWYFDGSDIDFGPGDIGSAWVDPATGDVAFSGKNGVDIAPLTTFANDVVAFDGTTGPDTDGTLAALFNGDARGLVGEQVDGLHVEVVGAGPPPQTTLPPTTAPATTTPPTTAPSTTSPPTTTAPTTTPPTTVPVESRSSDLSISLDGLADTYDVSTPAEYRVTISNAGPDDAGDVIATTNLAQGLQLVSSDGCTEDPNGLTCSLGTIPAGQTSSFTLVVSAGSGATGQLLVTTIVGATTADADESNNAAEVRTRFIEAPRAAADGLADSVRTPTDTPLIGIPLLANDRRGYPAAAITSFGGGGVSDSVTDHPAGEAVSLAEGSLDVNADGTLDFVPASGFTGSLTFEYRLANSAGSSDTTVTIGVGPIPIPDRSAIIYLSMASAGLIGDIEFEDEDILTYDFVRESWSMFFDGSDVDVGRRDVNGFHIINPEAELPTILLTLDNPLGLPGFGFVDDSDILRFEPTSLGETTAGSFSLALDGSTVGLDSGAEDIDAITLSLEGDLLLSTSGSPNVDGVSGSTLAAQESDVLLLGDDGTFEVAFEGASFDENITAAWLDVETHHLHAAFRRGVSVGGLDGENSDVFLFPMQPGIGGPRLVGTLFDGAGRGLSQEQIDGVSIHYRESTISSDPPVITSDGGGDAASISIAENSPPPGTIVWGRGPFSSTQTSLQSSEAVDRDGNVVTTGFFQGTIDVDPGPDTAELTSAGGFDLFISKIDSTGELMWAWSIGSAGDDRGAGLAFDASGDIFLTGYFQGTVDFDHDEAAVELTAGGTEDVFVAKLTAGGELTWVRQFGGSSDSQGAGVAVDAEGRVISIDDFVTDVEALDSDGDTENGGGLAYRLTTFTGGQDNGTFTVDPRTGLVAFVATPDFESPTDVNADNVYEIEVTVSDSRGLTDTQRLEITVTDIAD